MLYIILGLALFLLLRPFLGFGRSLYIFRRTNIRICCKQFMEINKNVENSPFFIRNICAFLRIYEKIFIAGLFSLSGLSREVHRVWEKIFKMLSWSFGWWKKSKKSRIDRFIYLGWTGLCCWVKWHQEKLKTYHQIYRSMMIR